MYNEHEGPKFYYDEAGQAVSVRVKTGSSGPETFYYYGRNIFGDIIEIYDASGNVVAKYTYNAWGEVLSVTDASGNAITSTTHIGNLNPLRYRGYYYDSETGFYYLQSRYYDPVMKRFLNADGAELIIVANELLKYNAFSYCANNPIMRKDENGMWLIEALEWLWEKGSDIIEDVGEALEKAWDYITNTDEGVVLNAKFIAFYNGVVVIKLPFNIYDSGSFGAIFLGDKWQNDREGRNALRHEFGHVMQLEEYGILGYIWKVAIPSVGGWVETKNNDWENYYNSPWEYEADLYGGVPQSERTYSESAHRDYLMWKYARIITNLFRAHKYKDPIHSVM